MENFKERIKVVLPTQNLNDNEARRAYEQFVSEQEEPFVLFINYLNKYINELKERGVISPFLKFYARIKSTSSAIENHDKKALDDVFGIEFICATDGEIQILQREIESLLSIHKIKSHNKENGYKAIHHSCTLKEGTVNNISMKQGGIKGNKNNFPVIEIQYKTIQVYYEAVFGKASHEKYKDTELSKIQELYDNGKLKAGEDIPNTWISNAEGDRAKRMSVEEVLKKMYPSLVLKNEKSKLIELIGE